MSVETWLMLAFAAGFAAAIARYRLSGCLLPAAILFALPAALVAAFGWPPYGDVELLPLFWLAFAFPGAAFAAASVLLGIVK
jgi:hypothetical protein